MENLEEEMKNWRIWRNMKNEHVGLKTLFDKIPEIGYTNLVKCAWFKENTKKNQTKIPDEVFQLCAKFLKRQVEILNPEIIIFLGKGTFDKAQKIYGTDSLMQKYLKEAYWIYHTSYPINYWRKNTKKEARKRVEKVLNKLKRIKNSLLV